MEDLYSSFTISILRLNKLVQRIKTYEISKYGLKPIHISCTYYLNKNPQGLTAKEICELSLEDKAAVSRALKIMLEKGYVQYDPNSRNSAVRLTEEGKKLAKVICERAENAVAFGSINFTEQERKFFYGSLDAIVDNLKSYYKELIKN